MISTPTSIHLGRLMSPEEVRQATHLRDDVPEKHRHAWTLCGEASPRFHDSFNRHLANRAFRLTAFRSMRTAYAVFSIQAESSQCRFLLPLGAQVATSFLAAAAQSGFMLSLAAPGSSRAFLLPFEMEPVHILPVYELSRRTVPAKRGSVAEELASITREMMHPDRVPSVSPGIAVGSVDVVLVMPDY